MFWWSLQIGFLEQWLRGAGAADRFVSGSITCSVSTVCCLSVQSSQNLSRQRNRGSDRMRTISPTSTHPTARAHRHTLTHTPSSHGEEHSLSLNHCMCVFGVYRYEASEDNRDSEAVMCEGRDQMRSSGMASLEEFVPSSSTVRKSAAFAFERDTTTERGQVGEGMLLVTACQSVDILVSADSRNDDICQNLVYGERTESFQQKSGSLKRWRWVFNLFFPKVLPVTERVWKCACFQP